MYDEHQMQRGSGRSAFSMSHLSSASGYEAGRRNSRQAWENKHQSSKTRRNSQKKAKRPKYPVVTEYDLIPEGKLIATVYKPPPPSAKTTAAANAGSGAVENVTGNANIQSSVSASAPAKEGTSTEAVPPQKKPTHVKADVAPAAAASAVVAGAKSDGSSTTAKPTTTKAISTDKVSASSTASQSIDASSKGAPGAAAVSLPVTNLPALEFRVAHVDHTGETYEGEIDMGVRHGRGTCVNTNGHMYEGMWSMG